MTEASGGEQRVSVYACWSDTEADVIVSYLRSQGVDAVTNSEVPHSVYPLTVDGLGKVDVLVEADYAKQALRMLEERPEQTLDEEE